jgi:hypothetical protein
MSYMPIICRAYIVFVSPCGSVGRAFWLVYIFIYNKLLLVFSFSSGWHTHNIFMPRSTDGTKVAEQLSKTLRLVSIDFCAILGVSKCSKSLSLAWTILVLERLKYALLMSENATRGTEGQIRCVQYCITDTYRANGHNYDTKREVPLLRNAQTGSGSQPASHRWVPRFFPGVLNVQCRS